MEWFTVVALDQGHKLFCKGPESKYFRFRRQYTFSVVTTQFCHCGIKTAIDNSYGH